MATICLDNTFVSEYLNEAQYTADFRRDFGQADDVNLSDFVRFEAFVPAFQSGSGQNTPEVRPALRGFQPVGFDSGIPEEAAEIRGNLLDTGAALGSSDVLIAGTARYHVADLVTDDRAFSRVDGLSVRNPKQDPINNRPSQLL